MRAAIYVRISSDPKGQGLGVARQEKDCQAYAARKGWTVEEVYVDNDVSATRRTPRPAYQRMLGDLDRGHVQAVVVWSYDRLCRRVLDLEHFLDLIERCQATVGCVAGDLDLASPMGRTLARVVGAIAQGEIEQMRHRLMRKQRQLAEQGKVGNGGRRPYGYTARRTEIIEDEAQVVREIARRILAGESLGAIARDLNDRGIPPARARTWVPTSVRAVVWKPHVAGLRVYRGQIVGEGQWPAILPRGTWEALRGVFDRPRKGSGASRHLLSGIARCAGCKETMGINYGGSPTVARYRCTGCGKVARIQEPIDEYVIAYVLRRLNDPRNAGRLRRDDDASAHIARELGALEDRRRQVVDSYATLGMTDADLARALARIDEGRARLTAEQARLRAPHILDGLTGLTCDAWDGLPLARRRAVVATLTTITIGHATRRVARKGKGTRGGSAFDYSSIKVMPRRRQQPGSIDTSRGTSSDMHG